MHCSTAAEDPAERYSAQDTMRVQGSALCRAGNAAGCPTRGRVHGAPHRPIPAGRHEHLGRVAVSCESNAVRFGESTKYQHACRREFHPRAFPIRLGQARISSPNLNFFMNVPIDPSGNFTVVDGISAGGGNHVDRHGRHGCDLRDLQLSLRSNNPCNGFNPTPGAGARLGSAPRHDVSACRLAFSGARRPQRAGNNGFGRGLTTMWDWASFLHYIHSPYLLTGAAISLGAFGRRPLLIGLIFGVIAANDCACRSGVGSGLPALGLRLAVPRKRPCWCSSSSSTLACPQLGIQLGRRRLGADRARPQTRAAYLAEIIRSGVPWPCPRASSRPRAAPIGMTWPKNHARRGSCHRALRIIIPPLGNAFNGLDEDLLRSPSVISLEELLRRNRAAGPGASSRSWKSSWWRALLLSGAHPRCGA